MLFQPTHRIDVIKDSEYNIKMSEIESIMEKYANRGYFKSFDSAEMFYEYFKTTENRASIVIIHGYTEFSKKYYELCWYFMQKGYNTFVYDLRGHGYSHRTVENTEVTHVEYFEDYVKDLECFINQIVLPQSDGAPVYLYSHSMGGAIATLYLANCKNTVQKTILSSPMIYPVCTPLPHQVLRILLKNEAKKYGWDTKFRYSSDFDPNVKLEDSMDLSKNRFQYNLEMRIQDIKYRNSSGSNRWNYEILGVADKILNRKTLRNIKSKVLIISAGKDTVVKQRPQKSLTKRLKCEYVCFENAKHSIYTMPYNDLSSYIDTLIDFYNRV